MYTDVCCFRRNTLRSNLTLVILAYCSPEVAILLWEKNPEYLYTRAFSWESSDFFPGNTECTWPKDGLNIQFSKRIVYTRPGFGGFSILWKSGLVLIAYSFRLEMLLASILYRKIVLYLYLPQKKSLEFMSILMAIKDVLQYFSLKLKEYCLKIVSNFVFHVDHFPLTTYSVQIEQPFLAWSAFLIILQCWPHLTAWSETTFDTV